MKTKFIRILYGLTAFLADKTNGFSLFAKWKITLGSLLIGLSVVSCKQNEITASQAQIEPEKDTTEEVTCYEQVVASDSSTNYKNKLRMMVNHIDQLTTDTIEFPRPLPNEPSCYIPEPLMCYTVVEENSSFPGGEDELRKFITENMEYPILAKEQGIEGTVLVEFMITNRGEVNNIKVLKSPDPLLSDETVRIIQNYASMETS